jgi:predicted small lipoprotein YifL
MTRQGPKKFALTFGVCPLHVIKSEVKATPFGSQPDLMQWFLQVDDNLAVVGKDQGDHASRSLVVDIGSGFVVDTVATRLDGPEHLFRAIHEFGVSHYNFAMLLIPQILVRAFVLAACTVALVACGQRGPLYLPQAGMIDRATLPESLLPSLGKNPPSATVSSTLPPAPQPAIAASAP